MQPVAEHVDSPRRTLGQEVGHYRWIVCALLFAATTVNYVDRQILSLLKPMLDDEFGWSNETFGRLNAAFQLTYAIGLVSFGTLIDRFGVKIGYALSIVAWSLAAAGHAAVSNVTGFFVARTMLGLGEGGNFPSAIKAVALWFPKRERALATAVFNSGSNFGAVIAPAIVPWVALQWGWRAAFLGAGLAGLVWLAFWLPYYDAPERLTSVSAAELALIHEGAERQPEISARANVSWWRVLRFRAAWAFMVAKLLTDPVWWFFLIWLPDFFKKTRGLDIKHSWVHLVTIYAIVTVLSLIGGWSAGYLASRGYSATFARKAVMLTCAFLALPIVLATSAENWTAVVLIGIAGAAHQAWSANLYTTVSDCFPNRYVATVVGLGGMAGSLGGVLFPVYCGKLLDRFHASGEVAAGYAILFALCGSAYLIAFVLHHLLVPRLEVSDV